MADAPKVIWNADEVLRRHPYLVPAWHPILPNLTRDEVRAYLATEESTEKYLVWYNKRETLRKAASEEGDPFRYGFELDHWKDADELVAAQSPIWLILLGGNRSGKSEYGAKRVVQDAVRYPKTFILCLSETERSSIETQQAVIWKYLPLEYKALNGKRDRSRIHYINYSIANGFAEQQLVMPNSSKIRFATYNQVSSDYEGLEFGNRDKKTIGAWCDESLTIPWLQMFDRRLRFRNAMGLWSFTPVRGMTPAIKEAVGEGQVLKTRPSELLNTRINVAGCPLGHMPYIQHAAKPKSFVMYFHSCMNPFGNSDSSYYKHIKEICDGKPARYVMKIAYGYTTESSGKAFPTFSGVNIVKTENLPAEGTNYMFVDPAGARNFACIWVRVTGKSRPSIYIYRDWPDAQTYGEWAVPTERELSNESRKGWDGDPGPATNTLNYGYVQYKQLFGSLERIKDESAERDPHRKQLSQNNKGADCREDISARFIDSRAGRDMHAAEQGGTCLVDQFAEYNEGMDGAVVEPMHFYLTSGVDQYRGLNAIEALLYWDQSKPFNAVTNSPRLFVSEDCKQVIWALSNYTGRGGETGACKDFVDLVRYAALADIVDVDVTQTIETGGGSY